MVVIADAPTPSIGVMQERVATPSMRTVQAPHSAMPQPNLVPVMPSTSRSTQSSGVSPSTSTLWALPFTLIVSAMMPPVVFRPASRSVFRPKLSECAEPVLHVKRFGDLAVRDSLNVDRHDLEALAGMRHAKQLPGGRTRHFAAHDHPVARDEDFFDVEFQIGN